MNLVMLHGNPGAGKLTTARELEKLTGYPVFHNHLTVDLCLSLFAFGSTPFRDLREHIWLEVMGRAAQERLPGVIFTFVFEPTVYPGFIDRLRQRIEPHGGVLLPVQLDCDVEENLKRVVDPSRAVYHKTRDVELVRGGIEAGDFLPDVTLPGNLVIDTTQLPAAETARLIVEQLGLGSS